MRLEGKVALISGGRRVGGSLARDLARRGMAIAMTYHTRRDAVEQTLDACRALGVEGLAIPADLSRSENAEHAVAAVVDAWGRIDVLVNMASIYRSTPLATLHPADFDAMIGSNLAPAYHLSLAASRQMLGQDGDDGIKGKIVNVGDWATERPYRDYLPYLVAKGGLKTLTLALAQELAPHVTVNLVQPAMIDPPPDLTVEEREEIVAATPLRRVGSPDDLNRLILYLLEGTDFATGGCYRVDGGRFLAGDA